MLLNEFSRTRLESVVLVCVCGLVCVHVRVRVYLNAIKILVSRFHFIVRWQYHNQMVLTITLYINVSRTVSM